MRRACLQAARTLAVAGLLTLPRLVAAQQQGQVQSPVVGNIVSVRRLSPGEMLPIKKRPEDPPRLAAIRVEMAWLSDPVTFPYPLQARPTAVGLEVCGFVPDVATKDVAIRLASIHSNLMVLDGIALDPALPSRPKAHDPAALQAEALDALKGCPDIVDLQVRAAVGGRVEIYGSVHSFEDKRKASRVMLMAPGCTSVDNRLAVIPMEQQGKLSTRVTADGSICVSGAFYPRSSMLPEFAHDRSRSTGWGTDRHSLPSVSDAGQPGDQVIPTSSPRSAPTPPSPSSTATADSSAPSAANQPSGPVLPSIAGNGQDVNLPSSAVSGQQQATGCVQVISLPAQAVRSISCTSGGFASNEPEGSELSPTKRTEGAFASGKEDAPEVARRTCDPSDFAAAAEIQHVAPPRVPAPSSIQPVVALTPAVAPPVGPPAAATKPASAAAKPARLAAPRVSPMTADGQWPSAFVGGQPMTTPGAPPVQRVPTAIAADPAVTVLRPRAGAAQAPAAGLLAQFKEKLETVEGANVRNVAFRYQEDGTVIMAITVADPVSEKIVAEQVPNIDELMASSLGIEIVMAR